jgi:pimeloyl-ACP methyl ester carboxylesterase
VRWDQRGHGKSEAGELGHTLEGLALDLATVLDELDVRDAVLAGHSMGGFTIQGLASHHPDVLRDRARALVLVATASHGLRRSPLAQQPALLSHALMQRCAQHPRLGTALVRGTFGRGAHPHHVERTRADFAATAPHIRRAFVEGFLQMDNRQALATLDLPTTVLVGRRDTLTPMPMNRELARSIPGARLHELPGLGHMLPYEAPDDVAAAILAHL